MAQPQSETKGLETTWIVTVVSPFKGRRSWSLILKGDDSCRKCICSRKVECRHGSFSFLPSFVSSQPPAYWTPPPIFRLSLLLLSVLPHANHLHLCRHSEGCFSNFLGSLNPVNLETKINLHKCHIKKPSQTRKDLCL